MGLSPLTRAEIRTWEADEGRRLAMWERRTLIAIDAEWLSATNAQQAKRNRQSDGGKK